MIHCSSTTIRGKKKMKQEDIVLTLRTSEEFKLIIPYDAQSRMRHEAFRASGEAGRITRWPDVVKMLQDPFAAPIILKIADTLNRRSSGDHLLTVTLNDTIGWARAIRRNQLPRGTKVSRAFQIKAHTGGYVVDDRSCPAPLTRLIGLNVRTETKARRAYLNSVQPGIPTAWGTESKPLTIAHTIVFFPPENPGVKE